MCAGGFKERVVLKKKRAIDTLVPDYKICRLLNEIHQTSGHTTQPHSRALFSEERLFERLQ